MVPVSRHHALSTGDAVCRLQHTDQIQTGLQSLSTGLPLCGADLIAMLVDELAGLQLAEELIGITANITGADFVGNDLALGVDNEGAALCHTISLDQNVEISGDGMGGGGQHGVAELLDAIGCIVPCFVDEVGIGGYGVDFRAGSYELVIDICQILQLGGADKSEVRRVEEEYAPLTQDILLGDGLEAVVAISLCAECTDFLVDHRHSKNLLYILVYLYWVIFLKIYHS